MKIVINLLLLVISINILIAQTPRHSEQVRANEFFLRQVNSAHPLPVKGLNTDKMLLPLMPAGSGFSNFLNVPLTVNESGTYKMQNESSIAINTKNPKNLIGSAVDYRDKSATWVYVSHDGAGTWTNKNLGRPHTGWSASNDPSVAFDLAGTAYLVIGSFGKRSSGLQGQAVENGVYILRSTDEGETWTSHIPVIEHTGKQTIDSTFEDKYYIWCDNSETSPYKGHLYIPWKRVWAKDSATQIIISKSTDKGNTWSIPVAVSPRLPGTSEDTTYGQSFPLAVTGPKGEVYLVWNNGIEHSVGFSRSTDGGATWTAPRLPIHYNIFGKTKEIGTGIWRHTVKGKVRAEAYPSLVVDNTNSKRSGWLYLTWAADSIPNIYFSRSTDKGETWSTPVIVHSETKNDQLWQWIALDKTNGDIAIMYLDSRDDPNNIDVAAYVSYSSDGGTTWTDRRAADISSDLRKNPFSGNIFAGDYNGCTFHNGIVYPSWVDMRNAVKNIYDSDVYTALVKVNQPAAVGNFNAMTIPEQPDEIKLKWDKVRARAFGQPLQETDVKYLLKREGVKISELAGNTKIYTDKGLEKFKLYHYSICSIVGADTSITVRDSAWAGGSKEPGIPTITSAIRSQKNITIGIKVPSRRLDGVTPLVNPEYISLYRDGKFRKSRSIHTADTGKTFYFSDIVDENGFYAYTAMLKDIYDNMSPKSEPVIVYAGAKLNEYTDDFNEAKLRKYLNESGWGLSSEFARTGNSLTDSPTGNYSSSSNQYVTIFPYEGGNNSFTLSFWHAAFVANGDSAIVEYSRDTMKTWHLAKYFNKTMYAPWADGKKDIQDWKKENIEISDASQGVYIRFRLKTNVLKNDDGWYIDDLKFTIVGGVYENDVFGMLALYPNPAVDFINVDFAALKGKNIKSLTVSDMLGNQLNLEYQTGNNFVKLNTKALVSGIYNVFIMFQNGEIVVKKFIKL